MSKQYDQEGGASIFIVIFTAIIVTVLAVSFTQLMIRTQQQTLESELSQRAYDSALAGVEDAKKALATNAIQDGTRCNYILGFAGAEQTVGQSSDNQAYTCVKVSSSVFKYEGPQLADGQGIIVPLFTTANFTKLRIKWFTADDAGVTPGANMTDPSVPGPNLPASTEYGSGGANVPPLLRITTIPGSADVSTLSSGNSTKTAFLYPRTTGLTADQTLEAGRPNSTGAGAIPIVKCTNPLSADGLCSATVVGFTATTRLFLHVMPIYKASSFTVEALDASNNPVQLQGLANVDSTGRAGNLFRRVRAQVELVGNASLDLPNSALYVKGNLCKTFFVTDQTASFDPGACTP